MNSNDQIRNNLHGIAITRSTNYDINSRFIHDVHSCLMAYVMYISLAFYNSKIQYELGGEFWFYPMKSNKLSSLIWLDKSSTLWMPLFKVLDMEVTKVVRWISFVRYFYTSSNQLPGLPTLQPILFLLPFFTFTPFTYPIRWLLE